MVAGAAGRPCPRRAEAVRTTSTIGAVEGSIIAAVMVTQTPMNQARPPRSVPGPSSMPRIRSIVTTQVTSATARSAATVRTGLRRTGRPPPPPARRQPSAAEYSNLDS